MYPITWRFLAAVCSGLILASAFPPVECAEAAWIGVVPLIFVARYSRPAAAFRWGLLSGLAFWLTSISWLLRLAVTGCPWPVAVSGWFLLSCYSALYTGAFCMTASALFALLPGTCGVVTQSSDGRRLRIVGEELLLLVAIPLLWVGFEFLRSVLFTGFSWNALGISQFRNLVIIQLAEWGGVYLVSALLLLMNTAIAMTGFRFIDIHAGRSRSRRQVELMVALLLCALSWMHGLRTVWRIDGTEPGEGHREIRVAAIQPNVAQVKKWPDEFEEQIMEALSSQTELALLGNPDLVVWPETAFPGAVMGDELVLDFMGQWAGGDHYALVGSLEFGGPGAPGGEPGSGGTPGRLYNSSFLVDSGGRVLGRYRKRHLVPFGEYIPLEKLVPAIGRLSPLGFGCTEGTTGTVFRIRLTSGGKDDSTGRPAAFSAVICFEDAFPYLARDLVRNGAQFLVNQTNDAWFDGTCGAVQHMSHCVLRCVENRVPVVRAANTGVTCVIDSVGRADILQDGGRVTGFAGFKLSTMKIGDESRALTFYTRHGDVPFALPCGIMAGVCLLVVLVNEKRRGSQTGGNRDYAD